MKSRSTIALLGAAQFVMVLDTTVMNVSITQVVHDLHTTVQSVQTAITLYALVMAALMLTGAKLGDLWGRRRAFQVGLAIYGVGSLTTALSGGIAMLLVGWSLIEGLGAVLVIPAIAALVATNYTGPERAVAYAALGGITGAAVAAGPLIGGFVTTALTWRVVFAAETVTVLVLLPLCARLHDTPPTPGLRVDWLGALLSALGLGLVVFAILQSSTWGLLTPRAAPEIAGHTITPLGFSPVPFLIAAGLILLGVFARVERRLVERGREPLLAPDLLHIPRLRAGASMLVAQQLIIAGSFFVLPLYLQLVLGKNALQTGVAILPVSVTMILAALAGPPLAQRSSPRRVVQVGLALLCAGLLGLQAAIEPTLNGWQWGLSIAGFGAGMGLVVSQLGNIIMGAAGPERVSEAGGVQGAAQNLGASLGTALIGAVLLAGLLTGFQTRVREDPSLSPAVEQRVLSATEEGIAMVSPADVEKAARDAGVSSSETSALVDSYSDAQLDALKNALLVAALFALVGLWFARRLPGDPLPRESTAITSS